MSLLLAAPAEGPAGLPHAVNRTKFCVRQISGLFPTANGLAFGLGTGASSFSRVVETAGPAIFEFAFTRLFPFKTYVATGLLAAGPSGRARGSSLG